MLFRLSNSKVTLISYVPASALLVLCIVKTLVVWSKVISDGNAEPSVYSTLIVMGVGDGQEP